MNNREKARQYFIDIGVWQQFEHPNMHHKDTTLRHTNKQRYDEWRIEDLVVMECADHSKLHMKLNGNCMDDPDIYKKHSQIMKSDKVRASISKSMRQYRLDTKNTEKEKERNRKISEKMMGNHNFTNPDTRSVECYCIVDDKKYYFHNYLLAGKWWYENFKPFGNSYSESTFQRKIKASIAGKQIEYGRGKNKIIINNIRWYKGGEVNE